MAAPGTALPDAPIPRSSSPSWCPFQPAAPEICSRAWLQTTQAFTRAADHHTKTRPALQATSEPKAFPALRLMATAAHRAQLTFSINHLLNPIYGLIHARWSHQRAGNVPIRSVCAFGSAANSVSELIAHAKANPGTN